MLQVFCNSSAAIRTAWTGPAFFRYHLSCETPVLKICSAHPAVYIQVKLIREKFQAALGDDARLVDINTIDGFQVLPCFMASLCLDSDGPSMEYYDVVAVMR